MKKTVKNISKKNTKKPVKVAKKTYVKYPKKSLFVIGVMTSAIVISAALQSIHNHTHRNRAPVFESDFGNFLSMQHAVHTDNFSAATRFAEKLSSVPVERVQRSIAVNLFMAGNPGDSAAALEGDKNISAQIAFFSYLAANENWAKLYRLTRTNDSVLLSPFRIWSGIATRHITLTLRFIDSMPLSDERRYFLRGMVFAETNRPDRARDEFIKISPDFLSLNDFLYLMAFYKSNNFDSYANNLLTAFRASPGGAYIIGHEISADFGKFSGFNNALSFGIIQNIAHSPFLASTNAALLLLRAAEQVGDSDSDNDALYFYLGLNMFENENPRYTEYFNRINKESPFRPHARMRMAMSAPTNAQRVRQIELILRDYPLFMPAMVNLINSNLSRGNYRAARAIVNKALGADNISDDIRGYLFTLRGRINRQANNLSRAADDVARAMDISGNSPAILAEQAKIWALSGENLTQASIFANALVNRFPTDIGSWVTLAMVVSVNEGNEYALEILQRVARVAETNSLLFQLLGDAYIKDGDNIRAAGAYRRAIELSDDGLTNVRDLRRRLRRAM